MIERTGLPGLAARRKAAGLTQAALAEGLGVSRSLVAAWEAGVVWPSAGILPAMGQLLRCSVQELFEEPEDGGRPIAAPTEEPTTRGEAAE